jgi:bacterioferritin
MDKAKLIERLNEAIALELTGLLQYNQYAHVLMGPDRRTWESFFKGSADEALDHARKFATRVVALGGTPTTIPGKVRETNVLHEMLQYSLEHEQHAVEAYERALEVASGNTAYRTLIEDQIATETEDVEELLKYLDMVPKIPAGTHNGHAHASHHRKAPTKLTA